MAERVDENILRALVELQRISAEQGAQVLAVLKDGKASLHDALMEYGVADEDYAKAYAQASGVPYVDLRSVQIKKEVLDIIPESTAREHMVIAYDQDDSGVTIAIENPADRQIVEFIHKKVDVPIIVAVASVAAIREALQKYAGSLEADVEQVLNDPEYGGFTEFKSSDFSKKTNEKTNGELKNSRGVICAECGNSMRQTSPNCYSCSNCGGKIGGCGI